MGISRIALLALVCTFLAGCAPATKIASNKAAGYSFEPKRMFIFTDIGSEFGNDFATAFQTKFTSIAQDCGVAVGLSRMSKLELDENIHINRMKSFNADTLLSIRRSGGTRRDLTDSGIFHVIYDIRLMDVQSSKVVYRATSDFYRGGTVIPITERGEALAVDITNKMKEDQVLRGCAPIKTS